MDIVRLGQVDPRLIEWLRAFLERALGKPVQLSGTVLDIGEPDREIEFEDGTVLPQWDVDPIFSGLEEIDSDRPLLGFAGVDLYVEGTNFIFGSGSSEDGLGLLSYARFDGGLDDEPVTAGKLQKRIAMQALSTVGSMIGVERCREPSCIRAYPNDLDQHDLKTTCCENCSEAFANTLGTSLDLSGLST